MTFFFTLDEERPTNTSQGEERTQDPETTTGEGTFYKPSIPTLGLICFLFHLLR